MLNLSALPCPAYLVGRHSLSLSSARARGALSLSLFALSFSLSPYLSVFTDGYALQKKLGDLRHYDITSQQYWWIWAVITGFLCLLLVLHTFWSFMIGKMLYNILRAGHDGLSKDIRSDSEVDEDTSAPQKPIQANGVNGTRKRASQRTRKASE